MFNSSSQLLMRVHCSLYINKPNSSASLKEMWRLRKENWLLSSKKKNKNEYHPCWEWQTTWPIAFILVNIGKKTLCLQCGLKVDKAWEILTVIMMSNDKKVCSRKRRTAVRRTFCFWQSLCPATHYLESWYKATLW